MPECVPCRSGVECLDFTEVHRKKFSHPEGVTLACQYGSKCYRKNLQHLKQFVHPGDRNYRLGMVHFPERKGVRVRPEFNTLRELFNYCDPDESGNISYEEFEGAWGFLQELPPEAGVLEPLGCPQAWESATGEDKTHLTFVQFARFATEANIRLPVGIDLSEGADRPCRFQYAGGGRCPCANFEPGGAQPNMCKNCDHKCSLHLSDTAQMSFEEQEVLNRLRRRAALASTGGSSLKIDKLAAPARRPGFTMVTDKEVLADLQQLLTETFKSTDNWTRDRGCRLHGRNACEVGCVMRNRAPVPTGFELLRAEKNRNAPLWQTFATTRAAVRQECCTPVFEPFLPKSCLEVKGEEPLDPAINEWRLLHGSGLGALKSICGSNFRLKMAGTGATWKDSGAKAGNPLYGYGVYCAESSTKADEYSSIIEEGLPADIGCHTMLVCRVVGGLCRLVDTNEFDTEELRRDVFDGPFHSVLGDRVSKMGKPYREFVVYDCNQVFPEFLLYYKRLGLPEG